MTESSPPPREPSPPPAPRPASPALASTDEETARSGSPAKTPSSTPAAGAGAPAPAPAPAAADESTPLLSSLDAEPSSEAPVIVVRRGFGVVYVLTTLSLAISATFLVLFAPIAMGLVQWDYYLPFPVFQSVLIAISFGVFCTFLSGYNLSRLRSGRPAVLFVNLILDLTISYHTIVSAALGLSNIFSGYDTGCSRRERGRNIERCMARTATAKLLASIVLAASLFVGLVHLTLFFIRGRAVLRTRFWDRPLHVPVGRLTFEFTIKLLKEPQRQAITE